VHDIGERTQGTKMGAMGDETQNEGD